MYMVLVIIIHPGVVYSVWEAVYRFYGNHIPFYIKCECPWGLLGTDSAGTNPPLISRDSCIGDGRDGA